MMIHEHFKRHLKVMQSNLKHLLGYFNYYILIVPPLLAALLWIIMFNDLIKPQKEPLEIAAIVLCGLFMLIAAMRFIISRHVFFLWSTALFLLILCREIHFEGTDEAIFIGLVVLLGILLLKYDRFRTYLANPVVINLLAAGFFTYFLSQTVDQRWWRIIPGENLVFVPLEETLEMVGHAMIGFATVLCKGAQDSAPMASSPAA